MMTQTITPSQGLLFSEPTIAETGVWVELNPDIEPEEWARVNDNLEQNKKKVGKKTFYKYLLNDLIVCASCERKFVGKKRLASRDNSYKCKGKIYPHPKCEDSRAININKLDSFLLKHLLS